jgi:hypothetical protein
MMQKSIRVSGLCFLAAVVLTASTARAQQPPAPRALAYDAARETVLQGTVLSFTASSTTPPLGARLSLQTSGGPVEIHLGSASYLRANQFALAPGDAVKVVGLDATVRQGHIFLARVIQKGSQSLALRTTTGAPLWLAGARVRGAANTQAQGGAR